MRRPATAAVTLALALGTLSACGGGSSSSAEPGGGASPLHVVQAAYSTTVDAKTAKVSFTADVHAAAGSASQSVSTSGSGVVDFATKDLDAHLDIPTGGQIELRLVDGTLYMKVPPQARQQIPGHTPWVSVDLQKVAQAKGSSLSALQGADPDDATEVLRYLQGVSTQVTRNGPRTIRGAQTTGYTVQVDLDKVAAKEGHSAEQKVQQLEQALGTHTLPVKVWLDGQGRVRQVATTVPIPSTGTPAGHSPAGSIAVTEQFYDFGVSVNVQKPAAGQTTDVTQQVVSKAKQQA